MNEYDQLWKDNVESIIKDGDCFVCKKKTNSLSCNPSEWGIFLAHIDGQQKHRYYHIKCLYPILTENKK